jgi:hypothetical protein
MKTHVNPFGLKNKPAMRLPSLLRTSPLLLLLLLGLRPVRGEIIFDNSTGGGTNVYYSTLEYGDEVQLGGTSRVVTEFQFEYYGDFVASGIESARIRIYKNDGPGVDPTPGTLLYDSGTFAIAPGYQTRTFTGLNVTVPTDLTWTVQFSGLVGGTGDEAGLIIRNPPSVGSSYNDFWLKTGGTWQLFSWNGNPVANFAARILSGSDPTSVSIRRDTGKVVVEWTGASILQVAPAAAGPYTDLPDIRNKYVIDPSQSPLQFWRLRD